MAYGRNSRSRSYAAAPRGRSVARGKRRPTGRGVRRAVGGTRVSQRQPTVKIQLQLVSAPPVGGTPGFAEAGPVAVAASKAKF